MDDYVLINAVENWNHLYAFVYSNIRELGVKLPKAKKINKHNNQSRKSISSSRHLDEGISGPVFGEPLSKAAKTFLQNYGYVPEFLVKASKVIDQHLQCEGIFRKSGSVNRQKELKVAIEEGRPLHDVNVFDMAVLIKQFFRELPEPLFLPVYMDAFVRCYQLPADKDPKKALLQLCLLLPLEHVGTLRFTMHMLSRVAAMSEKNKMTANNLALVMAPNLMPSGKGPQRMSTSEEKLLHTQTCIVEVLIKNWESIGMVSGSLLNQSHRTVGNESFSCLDSGVNLMSECFATDDEMEAGEENNTIEESQDVTQKKRRKRSSSLSGLVSSIAQGIAKLRRSTDGRSANMSMLSSTQRGELSIASGDCDPSGQLTTTPCVMRKRRASREAVPFSESKKKAILSNLPQRSALASTPFTPASSLKRSQGQEYGHLSMCTPSMGDKTARKKLNLFTSPASHKKTKRENSLSPPGLRSMSTTKSKNIFKRFSGARTEKYPEELSSDGHPMSSGGHQHSYKKLKVKKQLIGEPSPIIVPVCPQSVDVQKLGEARRSRRDEFEYKRQKLIQSVKDHQGANTADGDTTDQQDTITAEGVPIISPPAGFGDDTIVNVEDGSDVESEAGFSTISGGTVVHRPVFKVAAHSLSGSSIVSSVSKQLASSMHSLISVDSLHSEASTSSSDHSNASLLSNMTDQEVWVRRKACSTPEGLDALDGRHLNITVSTQPGDSEMTAHTSVSRKKSISAEDLQTSQRKVCVPVRAHSMYMSPGKKYNFKPHLEISKQTHNLLARAGYIQPTDSDAKDVLVPVKSPKRSIQREEMMLSLRSSFHERHSNCNVSFRSLKALPSHSQENMESPIVRHKAPAPPIVKSPLSKEKQLISQQQEISVVDVTGLDVTVVENITQVDVTDVENITQVDVTDVENDTQVDVTDVENDTQVDVTEVESDTQVDVTDVENDTQVDVTDVENDTQVDVTEVESDTQVDVTDVENITQVDVTGLDVTNIENVVKTDDDVKKVKADVDSIISDFNYTSADVYNSDINSINDTMDENRSAKSNSKHQILSDKIPKRKLKNLSRALTLSGILDQELVQQVKIKRAEVTLQKHDSVVYIRQAGLVSHSIRHLNQDLHRDGSSLNSTSTRRMASPVRIPTVFAKSHRRAGHYGHLALDARERCGNMEVVSPGESGGHLMSHSIGQVADLPAGLTSPQKRLEIDLSESLMETINDICTPRLGRLQELRSPLQESTNHVQSATVASLKPGYTDKHVAAAVTPLRSHLSNDLKPLQVPSSARNSRPQIKRLRVQHSPRKINHRSPKMASPYRSPKAPLSKHN